MVSRIFSALDDHFANNAMFYIFLQDHIWNVIIGLLDSEPASPSHDITTLLL